MRSNPEGGETMSTTRIVTGVLGQRLVVRERPKNCCKSPAIDVGY